MIRNRHLLAALVLVPLALWAAAVLPGSVAGNGGFWQWRRAVVLLSGVIVLWWMSAGILLATRPAWLERALGGLDRLYRLHRDIGIGAGVLVFLHWMAEWAPKNLAKLGLLPPRGRGPRGEPSLWIDLAKDVGEWAGYLVMALVVVSLLRRVPYRAFRLIHKAFAVLFVAGTFHGLVLMPRDWWSGPLAWSTALLALAGFGAAPLPLGGSAAAAAAPGSARRRGGGGIGGPVVLGVAAGHLLAHLGPRPVPEAREVRGDLDRSPRR